MFFSQDRTTLRRYFATAWRKRIEGAPLEPLEATISDVVAMHPEYHGLLESGEEVLARDYPPELGETNPFLHLAMHMGIREQLATNRPAELRALHGALLAKCGDTHETEHAMMECLAEVIWQAQRYGTLPDEASYIACLRQQIGTPKRS